MKKYILVAFGALLIINISYGQEPKASDLFSRLSGITDQYGDNFNLADIEENITLIFVQGTNTAFTEIYGKFKGKKLLNNVRVVAGWKDVMPGLEYQSKLKHMTDGFKSEEGLGKEGYPILFDLDSESHQLLGLERYSIVDCRSIKRQLGCPGFRFGPGRLFDSYKEIFHLTPKNCLISI